MALYGVLAIRRDGQKTTEARCKRGILGTTAEVADKWSILACNLGIHALLRRYKAQLRSVGRVELPEDRLRVLIGCIQQLQIKQGVL